MNRRAQPQPPRCDPDPTAGSSPGTWVESRPLQHGADSAARGPGERVLAPGTQLGSYAVVRLLGRGGMATVYEARHRVLQKRVALKVLKRGLSLDPEAVSRFIAEGQAVASLQSPHIVQVFDVQACGDLPFLVLEYLDGYDLKTELQHRGRLPLDELIAWMVPVLGAVDLAHARGIIHRDLKPSNIFLASGAEGEQRSVVLDFGISKCLEFDADATPTEVFFGTAAYTAPELVRGTRNASPLSDQYSLGVVLYECATGHNPFRGADLLATLNATATVTPALASSLAPGLPPAFDALLARAMGKEARFRYPDLRQMRDALQALGREQARTCAAFDTAATPATSTDPGPEPGAASAAPSNDGPASPPRRDGGPPRPFRLWLGGMLLVIGGALSPLPWTERSTPPPARGEPAPLPAATVEPPAAPVQAQDGIEHNLIKSARTPSATLPASDDAPSAPAPARAASATEPALRRLARAAHRRGSSRRRKNRRPQAEAPASPLSAGPPVLQPATAESPAAIPQGREGTGKSPCDLLLDAAERRYCQNLGLGD